MSSWQQIKLLCLSLLLSCCLLSCTGNDSDNAASNDTIFQNAVHVGKVGKFIEIPHKPDYLSDDQNNFLLFFWFTLKSLPADGERLVLISKYSGQPPNIEGYAVGLKRDGSMLRPVVFWGNGTKAGRWLDFPEIKLIPGEWNFLALQVHKAEFIGLYHYQRVLGLANSLRYLGSHEVEIRASGDAEILLGAPQGRDFKGKIGPFGIINPFKFRVEEMQSVLHEYVKQPNHFAVLGEHKNIKLLVKDGRNDLSVNSAVIKSNLKAVEAK